MERISETANFFLMLGLNDFHPANIFLKHADFRAHPRPTPVSANDDGETRKGASSTHRTRGAGSAGKSRHCRGLSVTRGEVPDPVGFHVLICTVRTARVHLLGDIKRIERVNASKKFR